MIKKLTIRNGIIQDKEIYGIPIKIDIVQPKGLPNVRTGKAMLPIGQCIHETGNTSPTANDENHGVFLQNLENMDKNYLSVHGFMDENSFTQTLPFNERAYHAGDGNGLGNSKYIGLEICVNGDIMKARKNMQIMSAALQISIPSLAYIRPHKYFSGKNCPERILKEKDGMAKYVAGVHALIKEYKDYLSKPKPVKPITPYSFMVKVIVDQLNYRSGPSTNFPKLGTLKKSNVKYTIIQVVNGWGKLKSGAGWINISSKYVKRV